MAARAKDIVFLVPGFFGYERMENFSYFAERVTTTLRALLEYRLDRTVIVDAVPIPPTASLAVRQKALVSTIASRLVQLDQSERERPIQRIHFVGHSAGGVDARLLTRATPLSGKSWKAMSPEFAAMRSRIRSVVSICSPHHGSCLAVDPIAKAIGARSPLAFLNAARKGSWHRLALEAPIIFRDLASDPATGSVLTQTALSRMGGPSFLLEVLRSRDLIHDLAPEAMEKIHRDWETDLPDVILRSFVTIAASSPTRDEGPLRRALEVVKTMPFVPGLGDDRGTDVADARPPGALFLALSSMTSGRGTECGTPTSSIDAAVASIRRAMAEGRVIAHDPARFPDTLDGAVNDGVVNTVRQLIHPSDVRELVRVVMADHLDVVGIYDRARWVYDRKTGRSETKSEIYGFLHSGSGFGDDEFHSLYRSVAESIPLPA